MPRKKSIKKPAKKSSKKKSDILEEVRKLEIKEVSKSDEPVENLESGLEESEEFDARGVISSQELSRVLGNINSSPAMTSLEQIQSSDDLEGTVSFAPRVARETSNSEKELKYSDTKYDANIYEEKNKFYDKEIPGFYSASSSSTSETGNGGNNNSNGNQ